MRWVDEWIDVWMVGMDGWRDGQYARFKIKAKSDPPVDRAWKIKGDFFYNESSN